MSMVLHKIKIGVASLLAGALLWLGAWTLLWSGSTVGQPEPPDQKAPDGILAKAVADGNQAQSAEVIVLRASPVLLSRHRR